MKNQWVRILTAGLVIEFLYGVVLFNIIQPLVGSNSILSLISVFIFFVVAGYWVGLNSKSKLKAALSGAGVGLAGIISYILYIIILSLLGAGEKPADLSIPLLLLNHFLKIFGGVLGASAAFRTKE